MKITHVHPQAGAPWCKDQTPIGGDLTEVDVWEEIRKATLRDEGVLFPVTYQDAFDDFREELEKGRFDLSLVKVLSLDPLTKTIHIPAKGPRGSKLVRLDDGKVVGTHWEPEHPATTKEIEVQRFLNLSTSKHARFISSKLTDIISTVVIWEPSVEAGDLDYLHELKADVQVLIFHQVSEKYGVMVEGDVDPENWKDEFPALASLQFEPPQVIVDDLLIKGNIHVVAGRFEAYKTMGLIELADAILSERPAFDHFKVNHRHPVMFLCADMSGELFDDYAAPFNLRGHGEDFRVKKPTGSVLHAIDSPVLQRAV